METNINPINEGDQHKKEKEEVENNFNLLNLSSFKYYPIKFNHDKPNALENYVQLCRLVNRDYGELNTEKRFEWFLRLAIYCNRFGMSKDSSVKHFYTLFSNHSSILDKENVLKNTESPVTTFKSVYEDFQEDFGSMKNNENEWQTPLIAEKVYEQLPYLIQKLTKLFHERERDVFLLGFLTFLSTCFPKVRGRYGGKYYRMNLFLFVSAPPASGKGVLSWLRICGEQIHRDLLDEYEKALKEYNSAPEEERKDMKHPQMKKLFIPADNTYAMLIKSLEATRVFGLIMDTEADTLNVANKSEHGNFSVVFRKLFEHETIEYERKVSKEYYFINNPASSVIISGTPKQVNRLLSDSENGFTSRFLFYDFPAKTKWKNMFEEGEDLEYIFKSESIQLASLIKPYFTDFLEGEESNIQFALTPDQGQMLNSWFSAKLDELTHVFNEDISGSIKRLGVIHFRLAMILTVCRHLEKGGKVSQELICSDTDFDISQTIISTLLYHTVKIFRQLQDKSRIKNYRHKKEVYLEKLPEEFDYTKAKEVANYLGINVKTAENYLRNAVIEGRLIKPEHNFYKKAK